MSEILSLKNISQFFYQGKNKINVLTNLDLVISSSQNVAIIGFYGVFLILVISYLTNIFFKHGEIHNLILFAVGIICLFGSKKFKNTLKINLIIFLFAI